MLYKKRPDTKRKMKQTMRDTNRLRHVSVRLLCTHCSPAFWPQTRSVGSVGSAAPSGEEAEEPQTLEWTTRSGRGGSWGGGGSERRRWWRGRQVAAARRCDQRRKKERRDGGEKKLVSGVGSPVERRRTENQTAGARKSNICHDVERLATPIKRHIWALRISRQKELSVLERAALCWRHDVTLHRCQL